MGEGFMTKLVLGSLVAASVVCSASMAFTAFAQDSSSGTSTDSSSGTSTDYRRPDFGARGVGNGDWVFVPILPTVFQHARPEYDPTGLPVGSFVLHPEVSLGMLGTDNVFAEEHDKNSDLSGVAVPAFRMQSDWSVHMLGFEGSARFEEHIKEPSQDQEEGGGTVFGRVDITGDDALFASAGYHRVVDPPGDPDDDDNGQNDKTTSDQFVGRLGYVHDFAQMNLRVDAQGRRFDYLDTADQDRDRNELNLRTRLTYAFSPRITPFVELGYNMENFDESVDDNGADRDAMEYSANLGANFLITDILRAELALGVQHTEFDDSSFDATTNPSVNGEVVWNITQQTSIIGRALYFEDVTTQAGSSSKRVLGGGVRLEQEVLGNLLVFGEVGYRNEDFSGIDRIDNRYRAGLGGEYLLNNYVSFFAEYGFEHRESDNPTVDDFTENTIFIGTRLQY
jgi:hypothetical protein